MKKASLLIVIALLVFPISAETVYWYTNTVPEYVTASGEFFDDSSMSAATDEFNLGSIIEIKHPETEETVVVKVTDKLPENSNRDIAITLAAAKVLGSLSSGVIDADVRLIKGEVNTEEEIIDPAGSGWFSYDLGLYENESAAYKTYDRLVKNGLKPKATLEEGGIRLVVPFVRLFETEKAEENIAMSGVEDPIRSETASPYL